MLVIASIAGAAIPLAVRLGLAMLALQFSIGAFNDLADAPRDRGRVPPKPIPAGFVTARRAGLVGVASAATGLLLVAPSGLLLVLVAGAGLGCGLVYNFGLSRTAISWAPLAVALPLVVVYAWLGATGDVPGSILSVIPVGALAGGGLAIGNALVDIDVDRAARRSTVAVAVGARAAWVLQALALGGASLVLAVELRHGRMGSLIAVAVGVAILLVGLLLLRSAAAERRRLGWQFEAAATVVLGVGWALGLALGA
ncbi:MAG: UbiA prenyltransferase family protein [Chloroflexi bacterium]|nr:UbiA prenyltransferase family protein [Chloroflexota bacterium]